MDQSFLIELLERALILQQKRVWSLEMLRRIEGGALLSEAPVEERERTIAQLEGSLRVSRECLNEVAGNAGYSVTIERMFDPAFVLGMQERDLGPSLERAFDDLRSRERESGTEALVAMLRELRVSHEPYLEDVERRVREDVDLQRQLFDFGVPSSPTDTETP